MLLGVVVGVVNSQVSTSPWDGVFILLVVVSASNANRVQIGSRYRVLDDRLQTSPKVLPPPQPTILPTQLASVKTPTLNLPTTEPAIIFA